MYFDNNSIKNQDGYITGTFKEYLTTKTDKNVAYRTIEIAAFCNTNESDGLRKLDYPIIKYYDFKNNQIGEEDIHKTWEKEHSNGHLGITYAEDIESGNVFFETLCSSY